MVSQQHLKQAATIRVSIVYADAMCVIIVIICLGIPSNLQGQAAAAPQQQRQASGAGAAAGGGAMDPGRAAAALAAGGAAGAMDFSSLGIPQAEIEQIRQLLASQPQLLPMLLQNLAQTNPELLEAIQQNPQAFMQMLGVQGQGAAAGGAGGAGAAGGQGGPRQHVIQVTEAEQTSIMNLINLGFDRHRALEAYLICDRNEEAAANYLFEHAAEVSCINYASGRTQPDFELLTFTFYVMYPVSVRSRRE